MKYRYLLLAVAVGSFAFLGAQYFLKKSAWAKGRFFQTYQDSLSSQKEGSFFVHLPKTQENSEFQKRNISLDNLGFRQGTSLQMQGDSSFRWAVTGGWFVEGFSFADAETFPFVLRQMILSSSNFMGWQPSKVQSLDLHHATENFQLLNAGIAGNEFEQQATLTSEVLLTQKMDQLLWVISGTEVVLGKSLQIHEKMSDQKYCVDSSDLSDLKNESVVHLFQEQVKEVQKKALAAQTQFVVAYIPIISCDPTLSFDFQISMNRWLASTGLPVCWISLPENVQEHIRKKKMMAFMERSVMDPVVAQVFQCLKPWKVQ